VKVTLLNQYYAPDEAATAQILADVGATLAHAGHDVAAVCSDRAYADPVRRYPRRETLDGVRIRRVRTTGFGRGSRLGRLIDYATFLLGAAVALAFGRKPDAVLCLSTPPMMAAVGLVLARCRRARFVFWVMDVYPDLAFELGILEPRSAAGRMLGWLARETLERSDRVVALGECMGEHLERQGARDVVVIHNWADENVIRPRPVEDHPLRAEWGWRGRFVVAYSGNLGLAHEFETVLAAAERLREHPSVLFSFIGGGPRRPEVEHAAETRRLANVELRPYMERGRLGESLTAPDVHLVTLRDSVPGLLVPSKIYGILAAGRPTLYVGPPRGEIAEIVQQGDCGARIALGDVDALVESILAYERDADRCSRDGRCARRFFEERFTRARGAGAFVRLIERLVAGEA
jgi:glycosyltransferase involved in cell wall biosynthesis